LIDVIVVVVAVVVTISATARVVKLPLMIKEEKELHSNAERIPVDMSIQFDLYISF
jgi:hypothetical protein